MPEDAGDISPADSMRWNPIADVKSGSQETHFRTSTTTDPGDEPRRAGLLIQRETLDGLRLRRGCHNPLGRATLAIPTLRISEGPLNRREVVSPDPQRYGARGYGRNG